MSADHWTIVVEVASPHVNTETIRLRLDLIEGVECVAISLDEDDAKRVLGLEPDTLVVDVRGAADE